ncbi:hypothetical protein Scep_001943 [Stephania cephalantha]|uniref:Uncharacterized protein n=1 Tax=Stephania cephalantha TaxID=152367 RepID=A0AAP0L906_9MAGN
MARSDQPPLRGRTLPHGGRGIPLGSGVLVQSEEVQHRHEEPIYRLDLMDRLHEGVEEVVAVEVVGRFLSHRFRLLVHSIMSYSQRHLHLPCRPRRLYHRHCHLEPYQIAYYSHHRRHRDMTLLYRRCLGLLPPHHQQHPHPMRAEQASMLQALHEHLRGQGPTPLACIGSRSH